MPLNSCSARAVSCSVGHRTFDVILVSAIILEGIVVVAIIVASVYEVKIKSLVNFQWSVRHTISKKLPRPL